MRSATAHSGCAHLTRISGDGGTIDRAREIVADLGDLPLPGRGATLTRWQRFADVAAEDVSLVRIVEGHYDAVAILTELGHASADRHGLLGVWAARPGELTARQVGDGWELTGSKPFCSGSVGLDAALVAATSDAGARLFLVRTADVEAVADSWRPLGMAATASDTTVFDRLVLGAEAEVGRPGGYVERPGFGHGGCGVAACWWGAAAGLVAALADAAGDGSDRRLGAYGAAALALAESGELLRSTAALIDRRPGDAAAARSWAAMVRSAVARAARECLAVSAAHLGTSALAVDAALGQRIADLTMYLTQYRDEELVDAGRHLRQQGPLRLC